MIFNFVTHTSFLVMYPLQLHDSLLFAVSELKKLTLSTLKSYCKVTLYICSYHVIACKGIDLFKKFIFSSYTLKCQISVVFIKMILTNEKPFRISCVPLRIAVDGRRA